MENFNIICVDSVVADCAGYSIDAIIINFIASLWKHGLVYPVFVAQG